MENTDEEVKNSVGDLRKNIVKSLIENSIYFTFTSYDKIINEKKEKNSNYKEIIKKLEEERKNYKIIKYDNINPSIIAFDEDGQNFSVIATNRNDKKFESIDTYLDMVNEEEKYLYKKKTKIKNLRKGKKLKSQKN